MHERTRKRICRSAFFAFCLGPTVATAAWVAYQCRPSASAVAAQPLARRLQCEAVFRDYLRPRPGVYQASQMTLCARGANQPHTTFAEIRWQEAADQMAANIDRMHVDASQVRRLLAAAERWLDEPTPVELRARSLVVEGQSVGALAAYRLRQARVRTRLQASGEAEIQFVADGGVEATTLRLHATRTAAGRLVVELDASETPVPLALAAIGTPLDQLAPERLFRGLVRWEIHDSKIRGTIAGEVQEVLLAELLHPGGPHQAEGLARLTIETLEFSDGQIVRLHGQLESAGGVLSRSLLVAAARCLYCTVAGELSAAESHPFDRLAVRFELDAQGLTLRAIPPAGGSSPAPRPGPLVARGGQAMLLAPRPGYERLPPVFLAQFVAGVDERWQWHWLPASLEAARLFTLLPGADPSSAAQASPTAGESR